MNNVKFYRLNRDGSVQMAIVKVTQEKLKERVKRKFHNLRVTENGMLRAGWTRHKLRPTRPLPMVQGVLSALRNYATSGGA